MTGLKRAATALVVMLIAGVIALRLGAPDRFDALLASVGVSTAAAPATTAAAAPAAASQPAAPLAAGVPTDNGAAGH